VESAGLIAGLVATAIAGGLAGYGLARSVQVRGGRPLASGAMDPVLHRLGAAMLVWSPATGSSGGGRSDSGVPELLASPDQCATLARALELPSEGLSGAPLVARLEALDPTIGPRITALRDRGAGFATSIAGLALLGGTTGPRAWIKLTTDPSAAQRLSDLDRAPVLAWRLDRSGRLVWANQAYLTAVEARSADEAGMLDRNVEADAAVALTGQPITGRHSFVSGGQRRSYEVIHQPLPDGVAGLAFDQTAQAERLARIDREVRAHVETLNHLNDAVVMFDRHQELVFYNRAFARLWKLEDTWLNARPTHGEWLDHLRERGRLAQPGTYREWRTQELSVYQDAVGSIPDDLWRMPDGRILRFARQRQPDGGLLLLFEDISDTTSLKAQYQTQMAVQAATLDKLVEAVGVFAGDGTLKLANSAFCALWRVDPGVLETRPDFAVVRETAIKLCEDPAHWDDLRARVCDPSPHSRRDTEGRLTLLDERILSWRTRPLPDGATLVAWDDITGAERYQDQLQLAADTAREADALKTDFVRNIAYQLKNPLTPIKAYGEMLLMGVAGPLSEGQTGYIQAMAASAGELEETINRLMQLALIEAGKMDLDIGDVNIPEALESVASMVQSQLSDAPVRIEVACDPGVRMIRGDSARVHQMLYTITRQSLEAVAGQPDAVVRLGASARQGGVLLTVWDNGPLMPLDLQHTAFSQIDSNERRSGVGSVLVHRFAEMLGGWVAIRSEEGAGTTVSIHLPLEARTDHSAPELDLRAA
jgi:signal transduction histidine kinase